MENKNQCRQCAVCGKSFPLKDLVSGEVIRNVISDEILKDHPDWSYSSFICRADLADYRIKYVQSLLRSEKGELSNLENEVIGNMQRHELISRNTESVLIKTGRLEKNWQIKSHHLVVAGLFLFVLLYF
ncbi:hypothetical protein J529_0781 [Acinetobacter baumannii 99063]|uniref:Uncharacterized protein n=1 Tax=Acinetobacter baumannii 99063 TaxID=1310630 RepID=A0A009SGL4_ACIBA|nr:hypothetical protein ACINNAV82_0068 [Acinetobacter baumannii Naval-82]ENV24253.1 hypothetical protein F962_03584 [Acinetobacter baumannii NIPH 190]EXC52929.1 hypothetical protein J529_0781 [Acinetobacter baumannii 99063]KMV08048.1 hypothetical protein AB895_1601 [Acinetobacter baumannii]KMV25977.1 hypothetical protein AB987_1390 [Acinetobacter baumannii]